MRFRPQIFFSMFILGALAVYSIHLDMAEIATGCITLIGALGMRLLENE